MNFNFLIAYRGYRAEDFSGKSESKNALGRSSNDWALLEAVVMHPMQDNGAVHRFRAAITTS